jgi:hypothetical protein
MNNKFKLTAAIGAALIIFGVFSPIINVPFLGGVPFLRMDSTDSYVVIISALLGAGLCLMELRWSGLLTGIITLAITAFAYSQINERISSITSSDPNNQFLQGLSKSVSPGYAFALLGIGGVIMIASAFLFQQKAEPIWDKRAIYDTQQSEFGTERPNKLSSFESSFKE